MSIITSASLSKSVGSELARLGGFLRCRTCGADSELGSVGHNLQHGWPRCCGYTMEWITQRQIDEGYLDDPDAWTAKERNR